MSELATMTREEHLSLLAQARVMEAAVLLARAALSKARGLKVEVPKGSLPHTRMLAEVEALVARADAVGTSLFRAKSRLWFRR